MASRRIARTDTHYPAWLIQRLGDEARRTTRTLASQRNAVVAAMAEAVVVPYAAAGGKTRAPVTAVLARRQSVFAVSDAENDELIHVGARPVDSALTLSADVPRKGEA